MPRSPRWLATLTALILSASCTDESPFQPESQRYTSPPALLAAAAPTALTVPTVVMNNLDSPRGLAFGPEGAP